MPAMRTPLCEFCGIALGTGAAAAPRACPSCRKLKETILLEPGKVAGVREVMINQHTGEPSRKLVELPTHSVVVFLGPNREIVGLEIETKTGERVLRWRRNGDRVEYRAEEIGGGYARCAEMIATGGFDYLGLRRDIAVARACLKPELLAALDDAAN